MRHRTTLCMTLLVLCSAAPAAGQQPDTIGTGKIIGRVVDAASSQPIAGVAVGVQEREGLTSITDGEGRFILSGLAQGVHALELRHLAYGTHEQLVNVPPGATVELVLRLSAKAIELDPLEVRVTGWDPYLENQGFYRRQLRGGAATSSTMSRYRGSGSGSPCIRCRDSGSARPIEVPFDSCRITGKDSGTAVLRYGSMA